jgi:hypothetical protein
MENWKEIDGYGSLESDKVIVESKILNDRAHFRKSLDNDKVLLSFHSFIPFEER